MSEFVEAVSPRIVDVHSHASMPLYHDLIADFATMDTDARFPERVAFPPGLPVWTAAQAVATMERNGIAAQVLSLPDATVGLRGETAQRWARRINEALARVVADDPSRFGAYAVVPHDDPDATLAEIDYALDVLKLDGVATSTNIRGVYLGDAAFDPWMAELDRRGAVLFVHPTMPTMLNPVVPPIIEFSFDTARMVMNMVLSGAKQRFSAIDVISTHGGGAIPAISHRLELIQPLVGGGAQTREEIAADLRSFHYDLTSCMGAATLTGAVAFAGADKLLMGFDYPYAPEPMMAGEIGRFGGFAGLGEGKRAAILADNAFKLFPRLAAAQPV